MVITTLVPLHTIVSFNSGDNQRLCNILVQLIGCFISSEHSVCKQQEVFIILNIPFNTFLMPVNASEHTKTKALGGTSIINLMN